MVYYRIREGFYFQGKYLFFNKTLYSLARCYERTRDQGTLGSIAIAIVEPLGGHLFMYLIGYVGSHLGVEMHQPTSRDRSLGILLGIQGGSRGSRGDLFVRRFYISPGCHLLDKNFVFNSNNILIY
jgi:hypothetical protein